MYIVELEKGLWLAPWRGDPGRTFAEDSARKFPTKAQAYRAIANALRYRDFARPRVVEVAQVADTVKVVPREQCPPGMCGQCASYTCWYNTTESRACEE